VMRASSEAALGLTLGAVIAYYSVDLTLFGGTLGMVLCGLSARSQTGLRLAPGPGVRAGLALSLPYLLLALGVWGFILDAASAWSCVLGALVLGVAQAATMQLNARRRGLLDMLGGTTVVRRQAEQ
jgi:hypothetical protein